MLFTVECARAYFYLSLLVLKSASLFFLFFYLGRLIALTCQARAMLLMIKNTFIVAYEEVAEERPPLELDDAICGKLGKAGKAEFGRSQSLPDLIYMDRASVDDVNAAATKIVACGHLQDENETGYVTHDDFFEEPIADFRARRYGCTRGPRVEKKASPSGSPPGVGRADNVADVCNFHVHQVHANGALQFQDISSGALHELIPSTWGAQLELEGNLQRRNPGAITCMICNIPVEKTRRILLQDINSKGFAGTYNFFYLPIDEKSNMHIGVALINFRRLYHGLMFKAYFESNQFNQSGAQKHAEIRVAVLQGLEAGCPDASLANSYQRHFKTCLPFVPKRDTMTITDSPYKRQPKKTRRARRCGGAVETHIKRTNKFCTQCGNIALETFKYCGSCGQAFSD